MRLKEIMKDIKEKILKTTDKIRGYFSGYFVAGGTDNEEARKKHKRVGWAIFACLAALLVGTLFLSVAIDKGIFTRTQKPATLSERDKATRIDIKNLNEGVTHEETWLERSERDLLDLKLQQKLSTEKQNKLGEYLNKESVSKKELAHILKEFEREISQKYENKLSQAQQMGANQVGAAQPQGNPIEVVNKRKRVIKNIRDYIPAGSYVEAKMILGVRAGVGVSAEANPRQVLLRIVGKTISAGFGKHYLTTKKLMGCTVQCQVVGDLSSERAYLKPVLMTCAKSRETSIEIPVKGYVASKAKVGISGELKERGGDLVMKSFLAGLVGGLGSGVSQSLEPGFALSGGFAVKKSGTDSLKNIFGQGLGKGVASSSDTLKTYFMKRAEQYQPIIEIDEGVSVSLIFQEGFSLTEEQHA